MSGKKRLISLSVLLLGLSMMFWCFLGARSVYGAPSDLDSIVGLGAGAIVLIFIVVIIAAFIPIIFYCLTLQKTLRLTYGHHQFSPGLVWLMLIPLFNFVWHFILVSNVTRGVKGRMGQMGRDCGDAGWGVGLTMCILACCCWIPFLNWVTGIGYLVTWIIYWIKIAGYNSVMASQGVYATPGTPQPAYARYCVQCGLKNEGAGLFCKSCGTRLE